MKRLAVADQQYASALKIGTIWKMMPAADDWDEFRLAGGQIDQIN